MAAINSADEAAAWAHRNLPAKNTLIATDARIVEKRFQAKLSSLSDGQNLDGAAKGASPGRTLANQNVVSVGGPSVGPHHKASTRINKQTRSDAVRALGKTVRLRDKDHRKFVLRQACLVCGRLPSDPHHLTFTQPRALGRRVSDEFMVPLCRIHHRELHRSGERGGENSTSIPFQSR
jgi:hypothetical protein